MNKNNRAWARNFRGTAGDFIVQARERNFTDRSIRYWVKYNWNLIYYTYEETA